MILFWLQHITLIYVAQWKDKENLPNNLWYYERVILFVPSIHSNLNSIIYLIYFCASVRWMIPITIKQNNFIFWVQVIVYQLVDMCNNIIEVIFTTICNSFYEYIIVYVFFPSIYVLVWNLYSFTKYVWHSFALWTGSSDKFLKWSISWVSAIMHDNCSLNHAGK